ncbi:alkene reductase [Lentzea sp. CC55]|uniref:oxidoreductase n=1 Tax=Lentzea sp. CC55 TaxID=2884909 RepID=UPI001F1DB4CF|nr:alkene reductase [Lentzea sp. CC55]MCG8928216.1 alkene reductase [Lentzea sp. CC55]
MSTPTTSRLWQPLGLGAVKLENRLVLSPMTRRRAAADGTPTPLVAEYYAQRAGFGLVVTEGVYPSREGRGYPNQPGLVDDEQEHGWAAVTAAVHAHGTPIFAQLMHAGRVTSPEVTGTGTVLAPSAIPFEDHHGHHSAQGTTAATSRDISRLVQAHVEAARRARRAGFDGIELHAANGYLLQQFLAPASNHRTDGYGGTPHRRARFVVEVAEAVAEAIGADRVGIRVSPGANVQGALELDGQDVSATYAALFDGLRQCSPAYVSMIHPDAGSALVQDLRRISGSPLIVNTGFSSVTDRKTAADLVDTGQADAVAVGRAAIANPDLPRRWRADRPEASPDQATFYTGGATGYTDYPIDDAPDESLAAGRPHR